MSKNIVILGSTGSIGKSTLNSIDRKKNFKVILLSANKNISELLKQCLNYKVKNAIIEDEKKYIKYKKIFENKNIKLFLGLKNIDKILNKRINYCVNSISGIDGLEPMLKIIPYTNKILIANKESIICGWDFILRKLKKFNTEFIPIDSEHFSIWKLTKNENINKVDKIILTASGGPFLNKKKKEISNIEPKFALKHPNWKMGKKISIDSATMMNKIFEYIEAKNIFNLKKNQLSILIHPSSFVHAIIVFKENIIKFLAHETDMSIPISSALNLHNKFDKKKNYNLISKLNNLNFKKPSSKQFPLLSIIDMIPENSTFFETILITINDNLVNKYLNNHINYKSIHLNILKLLKTPFFVKFYKLKPKNIYDIKSVIQLTNKYVNNNYKNYGN